MTLSESDPIFVDRRALNDIRETGVLGPWADPGPVASAVVHLGSLKSKTSDEQYCMLDSGANVLVIQ